MNNISKYMMGAGLLVAMAACGDEYDALPVNIPEATLTPNTTLLELKTAFWSDDNNYIWNTPNQQDATPQAIPAREDGSHYIVHGRVISSDEEGNVFKSLTIQDETCALAFSINSYDLYVQYRRGQEIVVDATGMKIGKYNGLQQMGEAEWYANGNTWEASFMPIEVFKQHIELNGLPEVAKLDTIVMSSFAQLPSDPDGLRRYQSQLVRFNNVKFVDGGKEKFSEYQSSGVDRQIEDSEGSTLKVRTSGYCDFWNNTLPEGYGDLVVLMGYYGTSGWQLTLIDYEGCMNFGNPTVGPGAKDNPYTVAQAIEAQAAGKTPTGWVTGYIVGTVAPEVTSVSSSSDIQWTAEPDLNNTLVIAPTADCTDVAQCLVMSLPQDSKMRQYAALRENPGVYKKQIWVYGKLAEYMGTYGVTDNKGTLDQFKIDGVDVGGAIAAGDGTEATPYNCAQIVAKNPSSTTEAVEAGVWVSGYIVGYMPTGGSSTTLSGTVFAADASAATTNLVIGPTADCTDATKCVGIQLPTSMRDALALANKPGNLGAILSIKGDIMKYCGGPGVKNCTEYSLDGASETPVTPPTPGEGSGDGTEANPYDVAGAIAAYGSGVVGNVWVHGYIVGNTPSAKAEEALFGETNSATTVSNIILGGSTTGNTVDNTVFVQLAANTDIRSALNLKDNPGNMGKEVWICGSLEAYFQKPGLKAPTAYSWDGAGSTGGGDQPAAGVIYSGLTSTDASLTTGWTIDNVSLGSVDKVWFWETYSGSSYLKGSAYQTTSNAEAWAISPVIDLAGTTAPSVSFEHAAKFQTNLRTDCGIYARVEGASSWTKLTIPVWPDAGAWNFANSGAVSLTDFAGKKIQLAFKYVGTPSSADTWEIRNLTVVGEGGGSSTGGNTGGGDDPVTPPATGDAVTITAASLTTVPGVSTVSGYSIDIEKNSGTTAPTYHANTSAIRVYAKGTVQITGAKMAKIVFTLASDANFRYTTFTPSSGTLTPAQAEGDTSITWVGNASDVTFTVGDNATMGTDGATKAGQIRFTTIEITPAE